MDKTRRKFLKLAGLTAVAGVAAPVGLQSLVGKAQANEHGHGGHAPAHSGGHNMHGEQEQQAAVRWGMLIDTTKFHGNPGLAEKCIDACHSYHNVPDFPRVKDKIMWLWTDKFENVFPEHSHYHPDETTESADYLVSCNHCDKPPCVKACPTRATFKNPEGIVVMDFHRCIGCRFCMAACPYGARSFNWRDPRGSKDGVPFIKKLNHTFPTRTRGVVEKCNFCAGQLKHGELPLCVQEANKVAEGAMIFGNLHDPNSAISQTLQKRFTIQRKPSAGTKPSLFYII